MLFLKKRLAAYWRLTDRFGGTLLLLAFWGLILQSFIGDMVPRLRYFAGAPIGNDPPTLTPEGDFSVFWPAGVLARMGHFLSIYDHALFLPIVQAMLHTSSDIMFFVYPPTMLPVVAGISLLPFEWAAFVWVVGQFLLAVLLLRWARFSWAVIIIALLSPAAIAGVRIDQISMICEILFLCGLVLLSRYPRIAGGLLGLLAIKPQVGLVVPFVFIFHRRWSSFLAFGLVVLALCGLTTLLFGLEPWRFFLSVGREQAAFALNHSFDPSTYQGWGVSSFWLMRSFGAGLLVSQLVQFIVAAGALVTLYALRHRHNFVELTIYVALLVSPYGFSYAMLPFSVMLVESARRRHWKIGLLDAVLFLWPGVCFLVSIKTGHELTPIIVLIALLRAALPVRAGMLPAT